MLKSVKFAQLSFSSVKFSEIFLVVYWCIKENDFKIWRQVYNSDFDIFVHFDCGETLFVDFFKIRISLTLDMVQQLDVVLKNPPKETADNQG